MPINIYSVSQLWIEVPNIENCLIRRPLYTVLVCGFDKKMLDCTEVENGKPYLVNVKLQTEFK